MTNPTPDFETALDEILEKTVHRIEAMSLRAMRVNAVKFGLEEAFKAGREKGRVEAIVTLLENPNFVKAYTQALKEKEPV